MTKSSRSGRDQDRMATLSSVAQSGVVYQVVAGDGIAQLAEPGDLLAAGQPLRLGLDVYEGVGIVILVLRVGMAMDVRAEVAHDHGVNLDWVEEAGDGPGEATDVSPEGVVLALAKLVKFSCVSFQDDDAVAGVALVAVKAGVGDVGLGDKVAVIVGW